MAVKLSPIFNDAQLDSSGNPWNGAKLFTYTASSSTKQTTYQDDAGATPHTNPILLNSRGEPPAPIWLTSGVAYKFVLTSPTDSDPPVSPTRTVDDVSGTNDTTTTVDQWVAGPAPTFVSTTSFTLVGDQTSAFHVGRRIKTTNSGGTIYSTITATAFGAVTTVTVANDSGVLDSGLSAVSYGLLASTNPSTPLLIDTYPVASGSADKTKKVRFEVDGLTTATTRVITMPDRDLTLDTPLVITANAQSGTYSILAADIGKLIICTGTFTLNLTAAATLGSGWWCWVKNASTGTITIDPNGSETISIPGGPETAGTTITLPYSGAVEGPYNVSGILLWCDGSNFEVISTLEAHGSQEFLAGGTWTCPAGVTTAWIYGCGGGAGGGGANNGAGAYAGGGGSGAVATGTRISPVPGTAYTVTIAAAAAGGVGAAAGTNGNTTSIGALLSLAGGTGGAAGSTTGSAGGAPGARGQPGTCGVGGKGGDGGSTPYGGGGQGSATSDVNGSSAVANTGGGGGGAADANGTNQTGGDGGTGYLRVEW